MGLGNEVEKLFQRARMAGVRFTENERKLRRLLLSLRLEKILRTVKISGEQQSAILERFDRVLEVTDQQLSDG